MRTKRTMIGAFLLTVSGIAFQLMPAGGGQHYSDSFGQVIEAAGNIVGGGGGSASASSSSTVQAAASVGYTATFHTTVAFGGEPTVSDLGIPTIGNEWEACLELSTGPSVCSHEPLSGFVDPTASIGLISFNAGGYTVMIVLAGQGTPNVVPQPTIENPTDPDSVFLSLGLMNSRSATVVGGFINGPGVSGMPDGSGTLESAIASEAASTPGYASGGGWITVGPEAAENNKASFGFSVVGTATPQGAVTYQDHLQELTLQSTAIQSLVVNGIQARITGVAKVNGLPGYGFTLTVSDDGSSDTLRMQVPALNYDESGPLGGGNITVSE